MIGILVPMPEEIEQLWQVMEVVETRTIGSRQYMIGQLDGTEVVLAQSRIGKVASAVTAATMIQQFNVKTLVVSGVAGALSPLVKIGDVCVASSSIQHDMDGSPLFERFEVPLLGTKEFRTAPEMLRIGLDAATHWVNAGYREALSDEIMREFDIHKMSAFSGLLVSGDKFIGSAQMASNLLVELPDALFVEMEGAAVAQVAYEFGIDVLNIRVISDHANEDAGVDFPRFIDQFAKHATCGIVRTLVRSLA